MAVSVVASGLVLSEAQKSASEKAALEKVSGKA
jgi:hypothetical protein